jgi:signal transduction histidine kinase
LDAIPYEDVVDKQRFVLFRIFSISGTLVCLAAALKMLATIPNPGLLPWIILSLAAIMVTNYFFIASINRLILSYKILLGSSFALLHFVAYSCGGIRTGGLLFHGVIILYAYLMLGNKGGRAFTLLFVANAIYFYLISSFTDLTSFAMFKEDVELINQDFIVNALFSFYLIASQGSYLQSGKNILIQRLEKSKRELEEKNKELTASNELLQTYTTSLEKSNKELVKFASVASHDLKAPLRAIGTLTDFLEMDLEEIMNEESKKNLATIKNRVKRMELLLDALLNYSKVDRRPSMLTVINTAQLLDQVIQNQTTKKNYKINITSNMPIIVGDEFVLKSVLEALIENAIKFNNNQQPEIEISCKETKCHWEFNVTDNGIGIEEKYHEKIFVIFQTIDARDTFESTGAGLAVAKKMIEKVGGQMHVSSALNQGATFTFSLAKREMDGPDSNREGDEKERELEKINNLDHFACENNI